MINFTLSHPLLQRACDRAGFFVPDEGLVFFGLRGAVPATGAPMRDFATTQDLRLSVIDHVTMACTIGQWDPAKQVLAVHLGSTVPNTGSLRAALAKGGPRANQLLPGRYLFRKGMHRADKPTGHRAFLQASFQPVRRSRDNLSFDSRDMIDLGSGIASWVGDNIHCAHSDTPQKFSSAGCQVICGWPKSAARGMAPETGPWAHFITTAHDAFPAQKDFVYVLFDAADFAEGSDLRQPDPVQIVRFGSVGAAAALVQEKLIAAGLLQGPPDGKFGRDSLAALIAFQTRHLSADQVDGVCGPVTAQALGITLPGLAGSARPTTALTIVPPEGPVTDIPDDSDPAPMTIAAPRSEPLSAAQDKTMTHDDDLADIRAKLDHLTAQYPELTPINAALGPFLGRLLDGRKTAIGVIGALLTAFADSGNTEMHAAFEKLLPLLTAAAPMLNPLFLALTLWGALGKIEKKLVTRPDTRQGAKG